MITLIVLAFGLWAIGFLFNFAVQTVYCIGKYISYKRSLK